MTKPVLILLQNTIINEFFTVGDSGTVMFVLNNVFCCKNYIKDFVIENEFETL